ncbi:MAG: hypothetical protein ACRD1E_05930, partial [Terriglobales bacterium]
AMEVIARRLLAATAQGDELRTQMAWVRRLTRREPSNELSLRRQIARAMLAAGQYTAQLGALRDSNACPEV